ncbi:MAG: Bacterial alpha-L-rhamnosidase [Desertimonas sp.]|nr:Bacterial alpha-L-rhamnosidase [Desertimonas sp.]
MTVTVTQPRVEHRADPLGIGIAVPRLSWIVESDDSTFEQRAYEVICQDPDDPDAEQRRTVQSNESVLVPWPFEPLSSRARRRVSVRVAGSDGQFSASSDPLDVEVALLDPTDWTALPITAVFPEFAGERPIRFRRSFTARRGVIRARLYVSALGVYTVDCNGARLGDEVLAPGWTSYRHRLRYSMLDVTDAIGDGDNVIGITVAEGWYRGRLGFHGGRRDTYGADIGPVAQLELFYDDGTSDTVVTDGQWRASPDACTSASLYDGEAFDARLAEPSWATAGFDDTAWIAVDELASVADRMVAPTGPPVRRIETLRPVAIERSPTDIAVVDFGQNLTGRVRLTVRGTAGDEITLRHAEVLDKGELAMWLLRTAAATDTYTLAGEGGDEIYEPAFTFHGFRYASIEGPRNVVEQTSIEAIVCHSDLPATGTFECSDERLNQLHENVRWSMRGNFVDVPTDCPQRDERLGWTGDLQVFAPTAAFLYDCCGLIESWLADLAAEQAELGTVPPYVPWVELVFAAAPAAAWGDAAVVVPWVLYERFGDVDVLRRQYDSMRAWVDEVAALAGDDHLWDEGFQFGDWLDPAAPPRDPGAGRTDAALIATGYHAYTARLLARTAGILGLAADRDRYDELADRITDGFNAEFVTPTGRMASDAQTAYALALRFDLLASEGQRRRAAERLAELVRREDFRIGTGFVGTPLVCDALVDAGFVDDAYHLLLQTQCPSWLYPITMGATTVWERWDSLLPDGSINRTEMTSFNHYALGAIADFLHRVVAGLAPAEPGYRKLLVRPRPGGGLIHAGASLRTPYGDASVRWKRADDRLVVEVVVPIGSSARVELPGTDVVDVGPGAHRFDVAHRPAALDPPRPAPPEPQLAELDEDDVDQP